MSEIDIKQLPIDFVKRWEDGVDHHPLAEELARLIAEIDLCHGGDSFCFKFGGDGDNGESLAYILSEIFERKLIDIEIKKQEKP